MVNNRITRNTDIEQLKETLGAGSPEELRSSHRREQSLEKFAQFRSRHPGVTLRLVDGQAAFVQADEDEEDEGYKAICIGTEPPEQPVTSLPQKYYDYVVQKGMTIHEIGHVMFSSYPAFDQEINSNVESEWEAIAHQIWNALEDGAIEQELRSNYRVAAELEVMYENIASDNYQGEPREIDGQDEEVYVYMMHQAIMVALMDLGIWDSGELDELLDPDNERCHFTTQNDADRFREFVPRIEEAVMEVQSHPDPISRYAAVYDFFEDAKELIDNADTSGKRQAQRKNGNEPMDGLPDDAIEAIGEALEEAESLGDGSGGGQAMPGEENAEGFGGGGDDEGPDEEELQGQFSDELQNEVKHMDGGQSLLDEIDEFADIIQGGDEGGPGTSDELVIHMGTSADHSRWNDAEIHGKRLAQMFRRRLQQERRTTWKRNQRRGNLDTRQMMKAQRGNPAVFEQEEDSDEKDYSCMFIVDRSGSMSSESQDTEFALASMSMGLEDVGVDTSIIDIYGGEPRLCKPFGSDPEASKRQIVTGETGGGTPLTNALRLGRERVDDGFGKYPFIVVITDGRPHNESAYRDELNKCNFPVLGIYLRSDISRSNTGEIKRLQEQFDFMHRWALIAQGESVQQSLYHLVDEILF